MVLQEWVISQSQLSPNHVYGEGNHIKQPQDQFCSQEFPNSLDTHAPNPFRIRRFYLLPTHALLTAMLPLYLDILFHALFAVILLAIISTAMYFFPFVTLSLLTLLLLAVC